MLFHPVAFSEQVPSYLLESQSLPMSIGTFTEYIEDEQGTLSFNEVRQFISTENKEETNKDPAGELRWQQSPPYGITKGFTTSVYWLRFTVDNVEQQPIEWHLEFDYALLDHIELYIPNPDKTYTQKTGGDNQVFSEREVPYRNIVFALTSPEESSNTYYIRVKTSSSMNVPMKIWPHNTFMAEVDSVKMFIGFSYGIALLALIYTAVNAVYMRKTLPLWLAGNYISISLYLLGIRGLAFQHLWPNSLDLQQFSIVLFVNTNLLFGLQHARSFTNIASISPRLNKLFLVMIASCCLLAVSSFFLDYGKVIRLSSLNAVIGAIACLAGSIVSKLHGNQYIQMYIVAWALYLSSILTYSFTALGILPRNELIAWSQELGFISLVVFSTIAQLDQYLQTQRHHKKDQRRSLEALGYAEKKYRSLFENAIEGIFQLDKEGFLSNANKAYIRIAGAEDKEKLIGHELSAFSLGFLQTDETEKLKNIITENKDVSDYVTSFSKSDSSTNWISVSIKPILDEYDNSLVLYEGSIADITELKRREQAEKQSRMAEASTEAKSLFLANMSHEIRTPMNTIIGFTDLAIASNNNENISGELKRIKIFTSSLLGTINDILDFSKLEAGKLSIEYLPFSLTELAENIHNLATIETDLKGVSFSIDLDPDLPDVLIGDATRIMQMLMNLVNNAFNHTEKGEVRVELDLVELDKQNGTIDIDGRVIDTGLHTSESENLAYFSSDASTKQAETKGNDGLGLSLSISNQLIDMMGGTIQASSAEGKGNCVDFNFSCRVDSNRRPSTSTNSLTKLNVLIVDDKPESQRQIECVVNELGHQTFSQTSCHEALNLIQEHQQNGEPFDIVIIDWLMPEMDGLEFRKSLDIPEINTPKTILVSSYAEQGLKQKALNAGFNAFLEKPISQAILALAFDDITDSSKSTISSQSSTNLNVSEQKNYDLNGRTVLVVDDVSMSRELVTEILNKHGITVRTANNGKDGFLKAQKTKFDAILMDIEMPFMDGIEATKTIREFDYLVPIIAMTANAMTEDKERCLAAGMNGYVSKPIDDSELLSVIAAQFDNDQERTTPHSDDKTNQPSDKKPEPQPTEKITSSTIPHDTHGILLSDGLNRCQGNQSLYLRLLGDFVTNYGTSHTELAALLDSDNDKFVKFAHTLKGLSANLGMKNLPSLALELEQIGSKSPKERLSSLDNFGKELSACVEEISLLLAEHPDTNSANADSDLTLADDELEQALDELAIMVSEQKMESYDQATILSNAWPHEQHQPQLKQIVESLDLFEFEEATNRINELKTLL